MAPATVSENDGDITATDWLDPMVKGKTHTFVPWGYPVGKASLEDDSQVRRPAAEIGPHPSGYRDGRHFAHAPGWMGPSGFLLSKGGLCSRAVQLSLLYQPKRKE